ncbi:MAG: guanylate kinase [Bryobacteraceae bacterium]|jgi:guanylate kinase
MSIVFIVSAPSGSGKSTLAHRLLQQDPRLLFSISYTTRAPRGQEVSGQAYHFLSRPEFEAALARDEFLEHAEVFGNYYGTHRGMLERAQAEGRDLLLDIDVQGARQLKGKVPEAVTIFVLAPSRAELEKRLRARSEDSEEVIARRLDGAATEIGNYGAYDYVVVNRDLERSVDALASIVKAERVRRTRMEGEVRAILGTFEKGS